MKIRRRAESKLFASLFISLFISLSSIQGGDSSELGTSSTLDGKEVNDSVEIHCSRERSRAAKKIIDEYLMPFVEKERHRIPRNCRLHEDNNIFRDNEGHKIHSDMNEWKCGYCKKSFYEEKFLDKHFDNRHRNSLNVSHGKCLADICGALHCDIAMELPQKTKCNPAAASRNKNLCEGLADSCFPVAEGPLASRLHEFFLRQFCDAHTCTGNRKPFPRGRKRRSSTTYIVISVLTLLLLLFFYSFLYMYQRGLKKGTSNLRRLSQNSGKKKPS